MGMGSKQVQPQPYQQLSPQYDILAQDLLPALRGIIDSGFAFRPYGGQLNAPIDPMAFTLAQQMGGLAGGQMGNDQGPYGAAQRALQANLDNGQPIDLSPLMAQGQFGFQNTIAPQIKESLGANYGIRFGTPVAESLSRAGSEVQTNLNAQALPYMESARQRQAGAVGQLSGLNAQSQGLFAALNALQQQQLQAPYQEHIRSTTTGLDAILRGLGGFGQGNINGGFQSPQYAPSGGAQAMGAILPLLGIILGAMGGGPAGAAVGSQIGSTAGNSFSQQYGGVNDWYGQVFPQR